MRNGALEFDQPLAKEGRLGFWRWALMFFGIAGTYRKNDSVDVQYTIQRPGAARDRARHRAVRAASLRAG